MQKNIDTTSHASAMIFHQDHVLLCNQSLLWSMELLHALEDKMIRKISVDSIYLKLTTSFYFKKKSALILNFFLNSVICFFPNPRSPLRNLDTFACPPNIGARS